MTTKAKRKLELTEAIAAADTPSDEEIERYLADHHDEIEAKLSEARRSIARGEARPMEPLSILLREARRATTA
jgi:hypothetical protein